MTLTLGSNAMYWSDLFFFCAPFIKCIPPVPCEIPVKCELYNHLLLNLLSFRVFTLILNQQLIQSAVYFQSALGPCDVRNIAQDCWEPRTWFKVFQLVLTHAMYWNNCFCFEICIPTICMGRYINNIDESPNERKHAIAMVWRFHCSESVLPVLPVLQPIQ